MIGYQQERVPQFHLPLYGGGLQSRQSTETLRTFPRAYTCPTYSTSFPDNDQQQQQQLTAAADVAGYLGYACFVNEATKNPFMGPSQRLGLLSVLSADEGPLSVCRGEGLFNSEEIVPRLKPKTTAGALRRRRILGKICCGMLH